MPVRGGRPGFYKGGAIGGEPLLLPPETALFRRLAGAFLNFSPPTPAEVWEAQAEQRLIAAQAAALRLPPDSPPELVEAAATDEKGELLAAGDLRRAQEAVISLH